MELPLQEDPRAGTGRVDTGPLQVLGCGCSLLNNHLVLPLFDA